MDRLAASLPKPFPPVVKVGDLCVLIISAFITLHCLRTFLLYYYKTIHTIYR